MENCPEEFKKLLPEFDSNDESEQISETLICSICCDLIYKPVVLGCGHVFCFWCVHKSMSGWQKSQCAICRNIYFHFPYVCETLHFLLLKLYPTAYKRREKLYLEEENETGDYAPQLGCVGCVACPLQPEETIVQFTGDLQTKVGNLMINETGETLEKMELVDSNLAQHREDIGTVYHGPKQIHCGIVSVGDVLCGSCKHMLYRPIVLNCGHTFCICCVVHDAQKMLRCEVCQCPHPGDFPKVCLEFDQFLEKQFPEEYRLRSDVAKMKQEQKPSSSGAGSENSCTSQSSGQNLAFDGVSVVHSGVGCDSCGMTPIVGDRYRCKDCNYMEKAGYDLCRDCYTRGSNFPGRFNQQHKPDHEFEVLLTEEVDLDDLELEFNMAVLSTFDLSYIEARADSMRLRGEILNTDISEFIEMLRRLRS